AGAQPLGSQVAPTLNNVNRYSVFGVETARCFWGLASTRRVDIGIIADSNNRLGASGTGHEDQMGRAYAAHFGMYATRVEPGAPSGSWGAVAQGETAWAI